MRHGQTVLKHFQIWNNPQLRENILTNIYSRDIISATKRTIVRIESTDVIAFILYIMYNIERIYIYGGKSI